MVLVLLVGDVVWLVEGEPRGLIWGIGRRWVEAHGDAGDFVVRWVRNVFVKRDVVGRVSKGKGENEGVVVGGEEGRADGVVNMGTIGVFVVFVVLFWDEDVVDSGAMPRLGTCVVV